MFSLCRDTRPVCHPVNLLLLDPDHHHPALLLVVDHQGGAGDPWVAVAAIV